MIQISSFTFELNNSDLHSSADPVTTPHSAATTVIWDTESEKEFDAAVWTVTPSHRYAAGKS